MALLKRYETSFLTRGAVAVRCEIWAESDPEDESEIIVEVPENEPLIIEWPVQGKEASVLGSTATLKIVSPGDRTFIDLYTVRPGTVRLDVYYDDRIYWSGCLDPEFYEEPYDREKNYDVTLTFSDFGILKRRPYNLTGIRTLDALVRKALDESGIQYSALITSHISTSFAGESSRMKLSDLSILSDNFIDEDGVASDWYSVLEGILQPLALRLVQRAGRMYVYDINYLAAERATTRAIVWDGTGQTMGTDRVVNNIRVTFSPYAPSSSASSSALSERAVYGGESGVGLENRTSDVLNPDRYSFYPDYDPTHKHGASWDYDRVGFTIFLSTQGSGLAYVGSGNRFFKILPVLNGSEAEGVSVGFYCGHQSIGDGGSNPKYLAPGSHPKTVAMRSAGHFLPEPADSGYDSLMLRIRMEMLCDPRYNPFEEASEEGNEGAHYDEFVTRANFAFVPFAAEILDDEGKVLCHYTNAELTQCGAPADSVKNTLGKWKDGAASFGDAWLAWYDPRDLHEGTGLCGWKVNRQNFGKPRSTDDKKIKKRKFYYITDPTVFEKDDPLPTSGDTTSSANYWSFDSFFKTPDGQFIPYPPHGGRLVVTVWNGVYIFDDTDFFSATDDLDNAFGTKHYKMIRWLLYKAPEVTLAGAGLTYAEVNLEDAEYSGVANADAKDPLEIETVCGTYPKAAPGARGCYLLADGSQLHELTRAGRTDCPEQLLIGTLYSQYAERKTTLTGEISLDPGTLTLYADAAQPERRKFLMTGEIQNLRKGTSEATFSETVGDNYEGIA